MKERAKALIAVSNADDNFVDLVKQAFTEAGIDVLQCDIRSGKMQVEQYISTNNDIDIVIITEHQGNVSYTPEELDALSLKLSQNAVLVLITDQQKGCPYLIKLEKLGLWNAIFAEDASFTNVAKIILNPRTKKDARLYYGISSNIVYENDFSDFNINTAVSYITNNNSGDLDTLASAVSVVCDKLPAEHFIDVLAALPADVLDRVSRINQFSVTCKVAKEKKEKFTASSVPNPVPEYDTQSVIKKVLKKDKQKPAKKKPVENNPDPMLDVSKKITNEYSFVSTNVGVGCTFSAILCAHTYAKKGLKVAIVEFDNIDNHFAGLCRLANKTTDSSEFHTFTIGKVDYFYNLSHHAFITQHRAKYDVVVYDFGCCSDETINKAVLPTYRKFVVSDSSEWKFGELAEFISDVGKYDLNNSMIYLFPLCRDADLGNVEAIANQFRADCIPYESNPYSPSYATRQVFEKYFDKMPEKKKIHVQKSIEKRAAEKPRQPVLLFSLILIAALLAGSIVSLLIVSNTYNREITEINQSMTAAVSEKESEIASYKARISELNDQIYKTEQTVYMLNEPVALGAYITSDMVHEVKIHSDLDPSVYLSEIPPDGLVAATNISADIPLYTFCVALPMERVEEETVKAEEEETEAAQQEETNAEETN